MTWFNDFADDETLAIEELQKKPLKQMPPVKKEVGLFDGAASSPLRGAAAGFAKAADTLAAPIDRVIDHLTYSINDEDDFSKPLDVRKESPGEYLDRKDDARNELILGAVEKLEDKQNTGTIGQIGFGVGDYATRALIGSLGGGVVGSAALTGTSETNYKYTDLTNKGVDSGTAAKVALVDGGVAAVSTVLPISYGLKGVGGVAKDAALSIGGATALSTAGQAASGGILQSGGYDKQAKEYQVTGQSIGTDLALNALLFGAARGYSHYADKQIQQELETLNKDVDQKATVVQSALAVNRMEFDDAASPVKSAAPVQQNNHLKNLNHATENLKAGRPVNVIHEVKGEEKQKPVNYESMALPTNAKTIARKAQQEGIDPSVALTISHIETGGSFSHTAKNPTSTAHGLFQILNKTWKGQGGGDRTNVDEQIKQGLKHIKNANASMRKSLGREPVAHEQYLGHLLGPGVAAKVLKADPNARLIDVVRKYDSENANAIVNNNGMSGLTVGQAIGKWQTKWNSLSSRYGGNGTSTAVGMDGSSYDVAAEIRPLSELITSNDALYGVNPNYPAELQPRDRTRAASRQQIESMANDLRPEWLADSPKLSDGAPIIGLDGVVESGNGRTLAIGKAYAEGKADAYLKMVNDYAATRGMDISGIDQPVLVRTRLTDTDRVQFTKLANEADVAQFSAPERAKTDVDRLPDASLINVNNDGSINLDQSMGFVRGFIDQLPQSERANMQTPDGRLSQDGKRRIETALAQNTYGDGNLVARLSENLDDDSKNVLNALLRASPQLSQLGGLVKQGGRHANTIATDLAQAAQKLSDIKASGQTVRDYLDQGQLIDDGLSVGARDFLNVFDANKRSVKAIGEHIQSKIDEIDSMGDPRQGSLFGEELTQVKSVQDQIVEMLSNSSKYGADYINDAAKVAASVYHSTAKKMGITADELFARFPMRIADLDQSNSTYKQSTLERQEVDAENPNIYHQSKSGVQSLDDFEKQAKEIGVAVSVHENGDIITLSKIVVSQNERGTGKGSNLMQQLIDYADANSKHIALTPSGDFGGNVSKLKAFYKKFGFVENKGKNKVFQTWETMYRESADKTLHQDGTRGSITFSPAKDGSTITLNKDADFSTFVHELGHHFLEMHMQLKEQGALPQNLSKDMDVVMDWAGLSGAKFKDLTPEQSLNLHEKFAETFEQYLSSGNAPTPELKDVFNRFKSWMIQAYKTLQSLIMQTPRAELSQDIVAVMDSMLGAEQVRVTSLFDDVLEGDAVANTIMQNPDQHISVTRYDPDGNAEEITMTLRERLDELEAEAKQAEQDTLATQTAISCALQFGE